MKNQLTQWMLARSRGMMALMLLLALLTAFASVDLARRSQEMQSRDALRSEAQRRAEELMAQTLNGKVMGAMNVLGRVIPEAKQAANAVSETDATAVTPILKEIGLGYRLDGAFIVGGQGRIMASWDSQGRSANGLDVKFRSYFQMAMQGKENIYAAVSISTGERAFYFAAPIYPVAGGSEIPIGVAVARINGSSTNPALATWQEPAALLTPQGVAFDANRKDWVYRLAGRVTPERVQQIKALKQFGKVFDQTELAPLPFDLEQTSVETEGLQLAIERVPVQWNDPNGDWTLVLTTDLARVMPFQNRLALGGAVGTATLAFLLLGFNLLRSRQQREESLQALQASATASQARAEARQQLASISLHLQQAANLTKLGQIFLAESAALLEMRQGAIYLADHAAQCLECLASYGCHDEGIPPEGLAFGEGLLGQCVIDKQLLVQNNPPQSYWRISSGLGEILPRGLIVAPIIMNEVVVGVVELALLTPLDANRQALFEELLPLLAMNLEIQRRQQDKPVLAAESNR